MLAQHPMHIAVGNHDTGTNYMKDTEVKRYPDEGPILITYSGIITSVLPQKMK